MAHKNVIVIQKAGEKINPAYSSRVLKDYSSYMGAAVLHEGKLLIAKKDNTTQADITSSTEAFGDADLVFTFAKADKNTPEEDKQPFEVLKNNDGQTIMAAFLDGGFQGWSQVGSSHSDEYHCVTKFIIPKMQKLFKASAFDLQLLLEELKDEMTAMDFSNAWADRGNITLLAEQGPPITFSSNNIQKSAFNWGWTSNAMGYVEQTVSKETPAPAAPDKPLSLMEKLLLKKGKQDPAPAAAPAALTGPPDGLAPPPKTDTATVLHTRETELYQLPPEANSWTNRDKIKKWVSEVGYKPDGYKDLKTKVKRWKGTKLGVDIPDVNGIVHPAAGDAASPITAKEAATTAPAVVATATVAEDIKPKDIDPKHVSVNNLPLISPKEKIKVKTEWEKNAVVQAILGEDHRTMFDPKKLQEQEDTFAGFMDGVLGLTIDETNNWPFELFELLGAVSPHALAVLAFNIRNDRLKTKLLVPGNKHLIPASQKLAM